MAFATHQEALDFEIEKNLAYQALPPEVQERFRYEFHSGSLDEYNHDLPIPPGYGNDDDERELAAEIDKLSKLRPDVLAQEIMFLFDELLTRSERIVSYSKHTPFDHSKERRFGKDAAWLKSHCEDDWAYVVSDVNELEKTIALCRALDEKYGILDDISDVICRAGKRFKYLERTASCACEMAIEIAEQVVDHVRESCCDNEAYSILCLSIRLAMTPEGFYEDLKGEVGSEWRILKTTLPEPEPDSIPVVTTRKPEQKRTEQPAKKVKRAEIAKTLQAHMKAGEKFVSYPYYKKLHKWKSTSTIYNAVRDTPELHGWAGWTEDGKSVSAKQFGEAYAESNPQCTEADPSIGGHSEDELAAAYARVIEAATPDDRAILHQKTAEERRRIAALAIEKEYISDELERE